MINTLSRYIKSNNQHFKRVEYYWCDKIALVLNIISVPLKWDELNN